MIRIAFKKLNRMIFGYDVFISYSRSDSLDYAYAIASYFNDRGYECYIDQLSSTGPGENISDQIIKAIKKSSGFILVGSAGAQQSLENDPIPQEIDIFLQQKRNDFLIPISVNAALASDHIIDSENTTALEKRIFGLTLVSETLEDFAKKTPSDRVVTRILNAMTFTKKAKKLRNISVGIAILLLILIAAAAGTSFYAAKKSSEAQNALNDKEKADKQRKDALIATSVARRDEGRAQILASEARGRQIQAEGRVSVAQKTLDQVNRSLDSSQHNLLATDKIRQNEQGHLAQVLSQESGKENEALRMGITAINSTIKKQPEPNAVLGLSTALNTLLTNRTLPVRGVRHIRFSNKLQSFVVLDQDGGVTLVDHENYTVKKHYALPISSYRQFEPVISEDGNFIVYQTNEKPASVQINSASGYIVDAFKSVTSSRLFIAPAGNYLAILTDENPSRCIIRDVRKGRFIDTLDEPGIKNIVFSNSGSNFVTIGNGSSPKLWRTSPKHFVGEMKGHTEEILSACFSPNDEVVGTASADGNAKVWSTESAELVFTLDKHSKEQYFNEVKPMSLGDAPDNLMRDPGGKFLMHRNRGINQIAFSKGYRIATAGRDRQAILWTGDGEEIIPLNGHSLEVNAVAFSTDKRLLLTAGSDGSVFLWDALKGHPLDIFKGDGKSILNVSFVGEEQKALIETSDGRAIVWTPFNDVSLITIKHVRPVASALFSPDGRYLFTSDWHGGLNKWSSNNGRLLQQKNLDKPSLDNIFNIQTSADAPRRAPDEWKRLDLDLIGNPNPPTDEQRPRFFQLMPMQISPNSKLILTPTSKGKIAVWQTDHSENPLFVFSKHNDCVKSGRFLNDSKTVMTTDGKTAYIWNVTDGSIKQTIPGLSDFDFSGNCGILVYILENHFAARQYYYIQYPNSKTGIKCPVDSKDALTSIKIVQHRGVPLVVVLSQTQVFLYTLQGKCIWNKTGKDLFGTSFSGVLDNMVLSPDGEYVIVENDNKGKILNIHARQVTGALALHGHTIMDLKYTADSRYILCGARDRSVSFMDGKTGELIFINRSHTGEIYEVNFSRDASFFVSVSEDGTAKLFVTPTLKYLKIKSLAVLNK